MAIIRRLLNVPLMMLGRVQIYLFIQLTWSVSVTSHEKVSWPLTLRQEIPNIHINVNKGVFYLIISYLRIKSYNVLNYNNCSTDWSFPLSSCMTDESWILYKKNNILTCKLFLLPVQLILFNSVMILLAWHQLPPIISFN